MDYETMYWEPVEGLALKKKIIILKNLIGKNDNETIKILFDIVIELVKDRDNLQQMVDCEAKKLQDEIDRRNGWVR